MPEGRTEPITLVRSIDMPLGLGMVKLSYALQNTVKPTGSTPNSRAGEPLARMSVDTSIIQTFTCYDREQPVIDKMEKIVEAARTVFRPRPEQITSRTPVRSGPMTFDDRTPHDDV